MGITTKNDIFRVICSFSASVMNAPYTSLISVPCLADRFNISKYEARKLVKELVSDGLIESGFEWHYSSFCVRNIMIRGFKLTDKGRESKEFQKAAKRELRLVMKCFYGKVD